LRIRLSFGSGAATAAGITLAALAVGLSAFTPSLWAQEQAPEVKQALVDAAQFSAQEKYDKALASYRRADALSNHTCASCYLGMVNSELMLGALPDALEDALHAANAAGDDRSLAADAHIVRGTIFTAMAGGPADEKMNEAAQEYRAALALDPQKVIAHYDLGVLLLNEGHDNDAVAELSAYVYAPLANPRYVDHAKRLIEDPSRARLPTTGDFSFTTLEGATISNASLHGKVVMLDFWATWCPACREALPVVRDLHDKYASKPQFQMIGVSADSDEDAWKTYIRDHSMNWSEFLDQDGQIAGLFQIEAFPTFIILDRDGNVQFRQAGFDDDSETRMSSAIEAALRRPASALPTATARPAASPVPPATPVNNAAAGAEAMRAVFARQAQTSLVPLGALLNSAPRELSAAESPAGAGAPNIAAPPDGVENGDADKGLYRNAFLKLSYHYPEGWISATADLIDELNNKTRRWMEDHPAASDANSPSPIPFPDTVFQASPSGTDRSPFVRITIANAAAVTLDTVGLESKQLQDRAGFTLVAAPRAVTAGKGSFIRTDYEMTQLDSPVWVATFDSPAAAFRVTLEVFARSQQELDTLAASAQSLTLGSPTPATNKPAPRHKSAATTKPNQ